MILQHSPVYWIEVICCKPMQSNLVYFIIFNNMLLKVICTLTFARKIIIFPGIALKYLFFVIISQEIFLQR